MIDLDLSADLRVDAGAVEGLVLDLKAQKGQLSALVDWAVQTVEDTGFEAEDPHVGSPPWEGSRVGEFYSDWPGRSESSVDGETGLCAGWADKRFGIGKGGAAAYAVVWGPPKLIKRDGRYRFWGEAEGKATMSWDGPKWDGAVAVYFGMHKADYAHDERRWAPNALQTLFRFAMENGSVTDATNARSAAGEAVIAGGYEYVPFLRFTVKFWAESGSKGKAEGDFSLLKAGFVRTGDV